MHSSTMYEVSLMTMQIYLEQICLYYSYMMYKDLVIFYLYHPISIHLLSMYYSFVFNHFFSIYFYLLLYLYFFFFLYQILIFSNECFKIHYKVFFYIYIYLLTCLCFIYSSILFENNFISLPLSFISLIKSNLCLFYRLYAFAFSRNFKAYFGIMNFLFFSLMNFYNILYFDKYISTAY